MSGGSYDYSYGKVQEMADQLGTSDDPLRVAFAIHLRLVAKAMKDVEWVDSGDCSKGSDAEAIQAVLGASAHRAELPVILEKAEQLVARFERAIDRAGPQPSTMVSEEVMALRNAAHAAMNKLDGANERGDKATRLATAYSNVLGILGAPGEGADIEDLSEWARAYVARMEDLTREAILWRNRTGSLVWKLPNETTAGEVQKWGTEYQTELAKAEARVKDLEDALKVELAENAKLQFGTPIGAFEMFATRQQSRLQAALTNGADTGTQPEEFTHDTHEE